MISNNICLVNLETNNIKHMDFIGWRYPPIGWVEINVDGCSKGTQEWLVVLVES
jgi:hypothetical protein